MRPLYVKMFSDVIPAPQMHPLLIQMNAHPAAQTDSHALTCTSLADSDVPPPLTLDLFRCATCTSGKLMCPLYIRRIQMLPLHRRLIQMHPLHISRIKCGPCLSGIFTISDVPFALQAASYAPPSFQMYSDVPSALQTDSDTPPTLLSIHMYLLHFRQPHMCPMHVRCIHMCPLHIRQTQMY